MEELNIVILAAGQGTRMNSSIPKVLHKIAGKSLLEHVIETAKTLNPSKIIIIYGHCADLVKDTILHKFPNDDFIWVYQEHQLGTGHAVKCSVPYLSPSGKTLVLSGDVPLISNVTLSNMVDKYQDNIVILIDKVDNPYGYGRILKNSDGKIYGIIEEKDADHEQKLINEINTGIYLFSNMGLKSWLNKLSNNNMQNEYYLTDVISLANEEHYSVDYVFARTHEEAQGINNKLQLEQLERLYQLQVANDLLLQGVGIIDKSRIDVRGNVKAGKDCIIDVNCVFSGRVILGNNVIIGVGCVLHNVTIADDVEIKPYSILEDTIVGKNSKVGPYSRLRPGTKLADNAHIGNFVEIKNATIGYGSKVNHLTYIGDAEVGESVNVGAGSVTCNYDGKHKFKTVIENNVFIGSGTMMVAPVIIKKGGIIGAGSVVTKDTVEDELTVSRARQITVTGWKKKRGW